MTSGACHTWSFQSTAPQHRVAGAQTDPPGPKSTDLGQKLAFFGHFRGKNGVFWVMTAVKHVLNDFRRMQHMFLLNPAISK